MYPTSKAKKLPLKPPKGFHSIALFDDEGKNKNVFKHVYKLFHKDQVLVCRVIEFEFDEAREKSLIVTF